MNSEFQVGRWLVAPSLNRLEAEGTVVHLEPKVMQVLVRLAQQPGQVVSREQLIRAVWADTFVTDDVLKRSISELRKALGDDAREPAYIETIAKSGYRLIAPVVAILTPESSTAAALSRRGGAPRGRFVIVLAGLAAFAGLAYLVTHSISSAGAPRVAPFTPKRALYRVTFGPGLQHAPTWSPDGRLLAYGYGSLPDGNLDIWVSPVAGGEPVQTTKHPAHDWQPSYSPDGNQIVFRSERDGGGLFIAPALGGHERRLASFGYYPRWSPDGAQVLFTGALIPTKIYVVGLDGSAPREVGQAITKGFERLWAAWHPDGERISVWGLRQPPQGYPVQRPGSRVEFWTLSLDGGLSVPSTLSPEVERKYEDEELDAWVYDFAWSPSADALFFSARSRGVANIWKVIVDPKSLRWVGGPERMTTGAGDDRYVAVAPDGSKLAFNAESDVLRLWSLPFDPVHGTIQGEGEPLTPIGASTWGTDLTADGKKLAFVLTRRGERSARVEVRERSFADGKERILLSDGRPRSEPRWSPDGRLLAYDREASPTILDVARGEEQSVASAAKQSFYVFDWSPDGKSIVGVTEGAKTKTNEAWILPVRRDGAANGAARMLTTSPEYYVFQTTFSPDNRWVCFNAVRASDHRTSTLLSCVPRVGRGSR